MCLEDAILILYNLLFSFGNYSAWFLLEPLSLLHDSQKCSKPGIFSHLLLTKLLGCYLFYFPDLLG